MNHLVFAEPDNRPARELAADALEQMGYQAESATWRNSYLFAAWELRNGTAKASAQSPVNPDTLKALDLDLSLLGFDDDRLKDLLAPPMVEV